MDKKALIKALRDTVQSASNTVASGVSAPVDLIAAGLRKVGLPIPQAPVGGSQWMENMGLTIPVEDGIPKLAGETLGMIVPMAATAKAPQIAAAANRGLENLAAPRTLNTPGYGGQRGALYLTESLPNQGRDLIQSEAERLADLLKQKGFNVDLQHSGSAAGPSSYLKVFDPQTGRFIEKQIRISGHSKGPFNSQNIINVNADEFDEVLNLAESMRSLGKSKVFLQQEKAQELIQQGVKPKLAYKQAAEILERNNQPVGLMGVK